MSWSYDELAERPGFNLDVWASVRDESLSDPASLPAPEAIAHQIGEDVTAAIEAFAAVAAELGTHRPNGIAEEAGDEGPVEALLPETDG